MKSLKQIINIKLRRLTIVIMVVILLLTVYLQVLSAQAQTRDNANANFAQINQLLQQNQTELAEVQANYRETCLLNAETIAYIIQKNPDILGDVEQFRQLAYTLQVDEIHIFDANGCIFTGTHPEYFDFTFDSGTQMNFFKPLLRDKTLSLCQDITPNTAEGKLVQYSAQWSSDGQFIVQVGMYPDTVLAVTEKNELSYIFTLLQGAPGISLYAIDPSSELIVGSTSVADNGKHLSQLGFSLLDMHEYRQGTHVTVNGVDSFCVFEDAGGVLIGYVVANDRLYGNIPLYTATLVLCLALLSVVQVLLVRLLVNRFIVSSIARINQKLRTIGGGNLDERMDERSSQEFAELSDHINQMVQNLLATTDKISFVLNRTNLHIGVYEYNTAMKTARYTEHIPKIFGLEPEQMRELAADQNRLKAFIDRLRQEPVPERENTYRYVGKEEIYITLEQVTKGSDVLGIVVDVTQETRSLKRAQAERDIDLLTGLYNRRGMMSRLEQLFAGDAAALGCGAVVVVDTDGLKQVNDTYGHLMGDAYLCRMAQVLSSFGAPQQLAGRMGGDEFLLLIYGYPDEVSLMDALDRLRFLQKNTVLHMQNGSELPLRFSFGYVLTRDRSDYHAMLNEADGYMYNVKRIRKQARKNAGDAVL